MLPCLYQNICLYEIITNESDRNLLAKFNFYKSKFPTCLLEFDSCYRRKCDKLKLHILKFGKRRGSEKRRLQVLYGLDSWEKLSCDERERHSYVNSCGDCQLQNGDDVLLLGLPRALNNKENKTTPPTKKVKVCNQEKRKILSDIKNKIEVAWGSTLVMR